MHSNKTAFLIAAGFLATTPVILNARLSALQAVSARKSTIDDAIVPSATVVRAVSLGHHEWAADLFWISGLVYFGESSSSRSMLRYLESYARVVEDVDPHFRRAYIWGATVSIYSHKRITRTSVERSIGHLERGLRAFPGDGELLYQLGFNYWFELPPHLADEPERRTMRARGAEYLRQAASTGYGPQWLVLAAASTLDETGNNSSAVELLRNALLQTDDPEMRARIGRRIQVLSPDAAQDPGLAVAERTDRERKASFPYVPPALYLFVGPPLLSAARNVR